MTRFCTHSNLYPKHNLIKVVYCDWNLANPLMGSESVLMIFFGGYADVE